MPNRVQSLCVKYIFFALLAGLTQATEIQSALRVKASASSEMPYGTAGLVADKDEASCWLASKGGDNWIQVELEMPQMIKTVDIVWYPFQDGKYILSVSKNGSEWRVVSDGNSGKDLCGRVEVNPPQEARYLRLQLTGAKQSHGLAELRINGKELCDMSLVFPPIPADAVYKDTKMSAETRAANLVSLMTAAEKHQFAGGYRSFYIRPLTRFGLREVYLMDATAGVHLRPSLDSSDVGSIAYPCTVALAATWNKKLAKEYGRSVAKECRQLGADILLGPGFNLYRTSTCGRNFEYMGEDPLLAGETAVAYIKGVQFERVAATAKHFICNNHEWMRHTADSIVDARTLHELYMLPWYYTVHRGNVAAVMSSYNWLNGEKVSRSSTALNGLLRTDVGFDGLVMSDWGAVREGQAEAFTSGQNLIMPYLHRADLFQGSSPEITEKQLNSIAFHILVPLFEFGIYDRERKDPGYLSASGRTECEQVALQTAREGITLLKNNGVLPVSRTEESVLITGPAAEKTLHSGGGSGHVDGYGHTHIGSELIRLLGADKACIEDWKTVSDDTLRKASLLIVCVQKYTEERGDTPFPLENKQEKLVQRCVSLNPRTVVVVNSGTGTEMGWADQAAAVVMAYYPGQNGSTAVAEILTGQINPSGKLPFTIEHKFEDSPAYGYIPDGGSWKQSAQKDNVVDQKLPPHPKVEYKEGVFIGYRWYDDKKLTVRYPFGHGLSYTTFEYGDIKVKTGEEEVIVTAVVRNTGKTAGAETVQLYIGDRESSVRRPLRELKGYEKIMLQPGESRTVEFRLSPVALAYYDVDGENWRVEPGEFSVEIGSSSRDVRLSTEFNWVRELRYQRPTDLKPVLSPSLKNNPSIPDR